MTLGLLVSTARSTEIDHHDVNPGEWLRVQFRPSWYAAPDDRTSSRPLHMGTRRRPFEPGAIFFRTPSAGFDERLRRIFGDPSRSSRDGYGWDAACGCWRWCSRTTSTPCRCRVDVGSQMPVSVVAKHEEVNGTIAVSTCAKSLKRQQEQRSKRYQEQGGRVPGEGMGDNCPQRSSSSQPGPPRTRVRSRPSACG